MGVWEFFTGKKKSDTDFQNYLKQFYAPEQVYEYYGLYARDKYTIVDEIFKAPKEYRTVLDGKSYTQRQIQDNTKQYANVDGKFVPNPSESEINKIMPKTMYVRVSDDSGPYTLDEVRQQFVSGNGENDMFYFFIIIAIIIILLIGFYYFFYRGRSGMSTPNTNDLSSSTKNSTSSSSTSSSSASSSSSGSYTPSADLSTDPSSIGSNTSTVNQFQVVTANPPTTYQNPIYPMRIQFM